MTGQQLPLTARLYVALVIAAGVATAVAVFPRTVPDPGPFFFLLLAACLTSAWKVNLPIPLASGSTLSVSYAANLMAILLLGPRAAVVVAAAGVWTQCTVNVKQRYPPYRTVFSIAAEILTMAATGFVVPGAWRHVGPVPDGGAGAAAGRRHRHLLLRQHRPRRARDRAVLGTIALACLA